MEGRESGEETALRRRLHRLIEQARDNEEKLRAFNGLELKLIAMRSPEELVECIVSEIPTLFGLDTVTLTLVDPQGELRHMLEELGLVPENTPELVFLGDTSPLSAAIPHLYWPYLGPFSRTAHGPLYPVSGQRPGSVALLPLKRGRDLWGSLNLGSVDPRRYDEASRTDFLERLAAVVSICLENSVNYERLKQLGMKDALTGVSNRRYLEQRLDEEVASARRGGRPLTCMFLDIDHFKTFNDRFGHHAGDEVLSAVAKLIRSQVRRSDSLCRYGGEEFVLLMPDTPHHAGWETAERIRRAVAGHHFRLRANAPAQVTLSVGVAVYAGGDPQGEVQDGDPARALLRAADHALYEAKEAGRDRVVLARETSGDMPFPG